MGIWDNVFTAVNGELDRRLSDMTKSQAGVGQPLEKKLKEDGYGRKGLLFDPLHDQGYTGGLFRPKGAGNGFLSNFILKLISRRDPVVSLILHLRSSQVSAFCRVQTSRFETGFKIQCRNPDDQPDEEEVREIEDYIIHCGDMDNRSDEDKLSFSNWGYMITTDMLTYGHAAIERIYKGDGAMTAFLPLPAETIYYANKALNNQKTTQSLIETYRDVYESMKGNKSIMDDFKSVNEEKVAGGEYDFLQVINGKIVEGFEADDLIFANLYLHSDVDVNGYTIGPLERGVSMITAHLQVENHQKMFFTHGVASRGLLVIQGDVTPNQLRTLQAQWTNQVTGPSSAWRTPILAGIEGVQWQPLVQSNRDMEYAAYQDHVLRTIHAVFLIDPEETGFGYLSRPTGQRSAMSESKNEYKITASRDKGLRPLLTRVEALINEEVLPYWNEEYSEKYQLCFVGLDAETREEENDRLMAEVQLHTSLDEVRDQADLDPMDVGGNIILNPVWLQNVQMNMPKGLFMEKFMGIEGASERPDLQYIPDPLWFQWQQFQLQMTQMQAGGGIDGGQGGGPEDPQGGAGGADEGGGNEPGPDQSGGQPSGERTEEEGQANPGGDQQGGNEQDQQAMMEQQAQAAQQAVEQFIATNPELFKSMKSNLAKSDVNDKHIDELSGKLTKDFEKGAAIFMKEVMEAIKDDIDSRSPSVKKAATIKDKLPGGVADRKNPADYDSFMLDEGIEHELEHTNDRGIAREIAMDHLSEDKNYYKKLKDIEKEESKEDKKKREDKEDIGDFLTEEGGLIKDGVKKRNSKKNKRGVK
jgi:hypothetical protein